MNEQLTNLPHGSTVFTVFLLCIRYRAYCSRSKWTRNCSRRSHHKHLNAAKLGGRGSATQHTGVAALPQESHRAWALRPLPTPSQIIPTFPLMTLSVHAVKGKDCGYEISKLWLYESLSQSAFVHCSNLSDICNKTNCVWGSSVK